MNHLFTYKARIILIALIACHFATKAQASKDTTATAKAAKADTLLSKKPTGSQLIKSDTTLIVKAGATLVHRSDTTMVIDPDGSIAKKFNEMVAAQQKAEQAKNLAKVDSALIKPSTTDQQSASNPPANVPNSVVTTTGTGTVIATPVPNSDASLPAGVNSQQKASGTQPQTTTQQQSGSSVPSNTTTQQSTVTDASATKKDNATQPATTTADQSATKKDDAAQPAATTTDQSAVKKDDATQPAATTTDQSAVKKDDATQPAAITTDQSAAKKDDVSQPAATTTTTTTTDQSATRKDDATQPVTNSATPSAAKTDSALVAKTDTTIKKNDTIPAKKADTTIKKSDTTLMVSDTTKQQIKAENAYMEFGGPGLAVSANYDARFHKERNGWGYRIGIGFFSSGGNTVETVPFQVNYLIGEHALMFELGAGVTFLNSTGTNIGTSKWEFDKVTGFISTATIGFRYQPEHKGLNFRIGFVPILYDEGLIPAGGASIGFTFK